MNCAPHGGSKQKYMFWADITAQELKKRNLPLEWVDDMKTPSGKVHVGSLRGVVIHDLVYKSLKELGVNTKYTYIFDNHDPMDALPAYLPQEYSQYLGLPLYKVPSPEKGYANYAEYYAKEFQTTFNKIGCNPEILWSADLYMSGKMNDAIKLALDHADIIRNIYEQMYKKPLSPDWYPFQAYCESCGKVSTTKVTKWDGERVTYECVVDAVKWTKGCGHKSSVSPYSSKDRITGKLPWKIEWSAKWKVLGITVEGAGKDHMSRGGSHDLTSLVCKQVFNYEVPYPIVYEFFLIGGKKMSSSKGKGFAASDMLEILPVELLRFIMVRAKISQAIEFDPEKTDTIPNLFDEYQEAADSYFGKKEDDLARIFELSQIEQVVKPPTVRFSTLAQWVQMPNKQEEIKKEGAEDWAKYAKYWVENFAPEKDKFSVKEELPEEAKNLTELQKKYLGLLSEKIEGKDAEAFQFEIYNIAKGVGLSSKDAFQAIYLTLLGKDHGPKAAWLILSLDPEFVNKRFQECL